MFHEASIYVNENKSPYLRHTYRYSPLISYMTLINVLSGYEYMGKVLFVVCDMLAAVLMLILLSLNRKEKENGEKMVKEKIDERLVWIWLMNPFVFTISSRGSCESVIVMLVLLVLLLRRMDRLVLMTLVYSVAVHLKIYPLIFLLVIYLNIDSPSSSPPSPSSPSSIL